MLRAMLLPSGNNVANSLAIDVGGSVPRFVSLMNVLGALLGLGGPHFTTPVGLDTPARQPLDGVRLARLANVVLRDPLVASIVDEPARPARRRPSSSTTATTCSGRYPWVVGVKTGHTADAGYCLVGAARLDGVHLISVVLGAPSVAARDADTLALLRYGLSASGARRDRARRPGLRDACRSPGRSTPGAAGRARARQAVVLARARAPARRAAACPRGCAARSRRGARGGLDRGPRERPRRDRSVPLVTAAAVPAPPPPLQHAPRMDRLGRWRAAAAGRPAPGV